MIIASTKTPIYVMFCLHCFDRMALVKLYIITSTDASIEFCANGPLAVEKGFL